MDRTRLARDGRDHQGITDWFETGFYIFTSADPQHGWQWVGDHIRPRVRVPESGTGRWA